MIWSGKFFGALIGFLSTRSVWGAVIGALLGHFFDQNAGAARGRPSISEAFFRTTFELLGHVAKADGRVSEAAIHAARALMQELQLGGAEIDMAIGCFRVGKSPAYDADARLDQLRAACGQRHDLLRAFMELQLRAALMGNGMSPPSRAALLRAADRLGFSGLEFAHMEASLRSHRPGQRSEATLAEWYEELEVGANISDQELTKAYRRQMSRHHPDKMLANGLPESMAQMAKEKTQRIQEAYEGIRAARGMR